MLTRLVARGFKNLDIDVRFGPFTCIAGPNGSGKSNVFDAIAFLSHLAEKPLREAALSVRGGAGRLGDVRGIFRRKGDTYEDQMFLAAEMIIPRHGEDQLGQPAEASITYLRYEIMLAHRINPVVGPNGGIEIVRESLAHLNITNARASLGFRHTRDFRTTSIMGRRTTDYISTDQKGVIALHADSKGGMGGGRPRKIRAQDLPRTMLSSTAHGAAEHRTAMLARQEMASWMQLHLEPTALRAPDDFTASTSIASNGAHLPATLHRLSRESEGDGDVCARVANKLFRLVEDVRSVSVDVDEKRQLLSVVMTDRNKTPHLASSLSDGTLRFLALAVMAEDSHPRPLLCLEEPENGIHPKRIKAMLDLLRDLSVDPDEEVGADNPLRQVIVNTHSPKVVAEVPEDALLMMKIVPGEDGQAVARLFPIGGTWRANDENTRSTAKGELLAYLESPAALEPGADAEDSASAWQSARKPIRRVKESPELQMWLFPANTQAAE